GGRPEADSRRREPACRKPEGSPQHGRLYNSRMRHTLAALLLFLAGTLGAAAPAHAQSEEADRLREATLVLQELKNTPDESVPRAILDKAVAIAVFPSVKKGGLVVGGHFGRGVISAR